MRWLLLAFAVVATPAFADGAQCPGSLEVGRGRCASKGGSCTAHPCCRGLTCSALGICEKVEPDDTLNNDAAAKKKQKEERRD